MSVATAEAPRVLARPDHPISRKQIGSNALKVLRRLDRAGYKAYLVGGAVRDLMVGIAPKDFDVSTDARPDHLRRLFRNSRIIGRRFRLAHVFFQNDIIEVTTFRKDPDPEAQEGAPGDLLITDDNTFGTPRQDAFRRDFTVNALFYDIADFSVIDYIGGIDDLERRLIRAIGDPDVRFQEDPVRMLRACEMAGRLDFDLETETAAAVRRNRSEVEKAAPARMTEEIIQLLRCGKAARALRLMLELGLLEVFLPEAYYLLRAGRHGAAEFEQVVPAIDRLIERGTEPSDAALLAALLLPGVLLRRRDVEGIAGRGMRPRALQELTLEVVEPFLRRFAISRARSEQILQALGAFHRLGGRWRSGVERLRFASRPGFDDALMLLEILVEATGEGAHHLEPWKAVQKRRPKTPTPRPARARRPRRRRRRGRRRR